MTASGLGKEILLQEPLGNLLIVAPAGCGKTEALAMRGKGLLERRLIAPPQKILALSFSNRARDNIGERIRRLVGGATARRFVTVSNFHGFAARVYQAHAATVGCDPNAAMPVKGWLKRCLSSHHGQDWDARAATEDLLNSVNLRPLSDQEVVTILRSSGDDVAVAITEQRIRENRLDYGDLLRHTQRILLNPVVANLYAAQYGAILVDEFQDLTPQQLAFVTAIARDNATFAGDNGQAIYSFTGADHELVEQSIRRLSELRVIEFGESYRSSPAVIELVAASSRNPSAGSLKSAEPHKWFDGGFSAASAYPHIQAEAAAVISLAEMVLKARPNDSVGILSRAAYRRSDIDSLIRAQNRDYAVYFWQSAVDRPEIRTTLRAAFQELPTFGDDNSRLDALQAGALSSLDPADIESADDVRDACAYLRELVGDGLTLDSAFSSISMSRENEISIGPGLHLERYS